MGQQVCFFLCTSVESQEELVSLDRVLNSEVQVEFLLVCIDSLASKALTLVIC